MYGSDLPATINDDVGVSEIEAGAVTSSSRRFEDLNLSGGVIKGVYSEMKFEMPSRIQSLSLPMILTPPYKNLFANAYMGSGKTTCLVLAMLTRVDLNIPAPQALCLCQTTQHAIQIMELIQNMHKFTGTTSELCSGLFPAPEIPRLTAQVIVGEPGSVFTWIHAYKLPTTNLKMLVFDDAHDTACGYPSDMIMKEIVRWTPECQVLLFSTSDVFSDVKALESTIVKHLFVQEFQQLSVDDKEEESLSAFHSVKHYNVDVPPSSKVTLIKDKIMGLGGDAIRQAIIFVETSETARMLHEALFMDGYAVTIIQDIIQDRLLSTLDDYAKQNKEYKESRVLIVTASCLLTRITDLSQVNLVINYDPPARPAPTCYFRPRRCRKGTAAGQLGDNNGAPARLPDPDRYFRWVGRLAQFGRKAAVFNLLCADGGDSSIMEKVAKHFNIDVNKLPSPPSDDDFKDALKKAGLMGTGH